MPIREEIGASLLECAECLTRPFQHGSGHVHPDGVRRKWFQFQAPERRGYVPVPLETAMALDFMAGSLIIARGKPKGSAATLYRLVLNGPERGLVWRDDRFLTGRVGPCDSAGWGIRDPTFSEWMLAWVEHCKIGHPFGL